MKRYIDPYSYEPSTWRTDYHKEIHFISKKYACKVTDVEIDTNHPVGELVIFIKRKYYGYIDNEFYKMMDGQPSDWDS